MSVAVTNDSRRTHPRAPFLLMKNAVLGTQYTLSIAFVAPHAMKKLNATYRKKPVSTDILSFPLGKKSGEMVFSMPDVRRKAKLFDTSVPHYFNYLVIHGLVHLKGFDHSKKMDLLEKKYLKKFGIPDIPR